LRKYKFSLEPVLNYREIQEDLAQKRLAAAQREEARRRAALMGLHQRRELLMREMADSQSGVVNLACVHRCIDYMAYLLECIDRGSKEVDELAQVVEERRRELVEASKEKKAIERMKERDFRQYLVETRALEQKFIDEVATIRHTRALREGSASARASTAGGRKGVRAG
jgi:flagellar FliJ protein